MGLGGVGGWVGRLGVVDGGGGRTVTSSLLAGAGSYEGATGRYMLLGLFTT